MRVGSCRDQDRPPDGTVLTGLLFALCAMVLNSVAGLLQSEATLGTGPLLIQRRYVGGLAIDGLGWVCTVVALRHLPVFAVQAILGAAIVLTALIARVRYGSTLRPLDRAAIGACLVGLALVASSAGTGQPSRVSFAAELTLFLAAGTLASVVVVLRHSRHLPALAVIAGLGFGGTSLAVRAVHPAAAGISGLLSQPPVYLVICFWLIGLVSYTRALSVGKLALVTALYLVTEVIVPGMVGIALLGDSVRSGWQLPMGIGMVLASAGVAVLSHSPAHQPPRPSRVS
jgi:drug/metabolite transporter (DMT)-like permease